MWHGLKAEIRTNLKNVEEGKPLSLPLSMLNGKFKRAYSRRYNGKIKREYYYRHDNQKGSVKKKRRTLSNPLFGERTKPGKSLQLERRGSGYGDIQLIPSDKVKTNNHPFKDMLQMFKHLFGKLWRKGK
jgi:hypothetical protein